MARACCSCCGTLRRARCSSREPVGSRLAVTAGASGNPRPYPDSRCQIAAGQITMCAIAHEGSVLQITPLSIADVKLIVPQSHRDARGFFSETWSRRALQEAGIAAEFVQDNHSLSVEAGTLRGLHFQL